MNYKPKTPKCTLGEKHKWVWVKNGTRTTTTIAPRGTTMHVALKGLYKCACGERRLGTAKSEGADLRSLLGDAA